MSDGVFSVDKGVFSGDVGVSFGSSNEINIRYKDTVQKNLYPPAITIRNLPPWHKSSSIQDSRLFEREKESSSSIQEFKVTLEHNGFKFSYQTPSMTATEAIPYALQRLNNIKLYSQLKSDQRYQTVLCFGTFDLFHDLHKRLLRCATTLCQKSLVVFIYHKDHKRQVKLSDSVRHRLENVSQYLAEYLASQEKKPTWSVQRMSQKHVQELSQAIAKYQKLGIVCLFGGVDQFQNYSELLDVCFDTQTQIIAIDRGIGLCSSDIRIQSQYKNLVKIYDLAIPNAYLDSPHLHQLWKYKGCERDYLLRDIECGQLTSEIWKSCPSKLDEIVINPVKKGRCLICLPGSTSCDSARVRKILLTLKDLVSSGNGSVPSSDLYMVCYQSSTYSTGHYLSQLKLDPQGYFSQEALFITYMFLLPRLCESLKSSAEALSQVTFWGRSRGSVITWEIENAFRYCLKKRNYSDSEIDYLGRHVAVFNICNLVDPLAARLFLTVTATGTNDSKAHQYIPNFDRFVKVKRQSGYQSMMASDHNLAVLAHLPPKVYTHEGYDGEWKRLVQVKDIKRHYAPFFLAPRVGSRSYLSRWIHLLLRKVVERETNFDLISVIPSFYRINLAIEMELLRY